MLLEEVRWLDNAAGPFFRSAEDAVVWMEIFTFCREISSLHDYVIRYNTLTNILSNSVWRGSAQATVQLVAPVLHVVNAQW